MTLPVKKRINTELLIDRNKGLYVQKVDKERDQENILIKKWIRKYLTNLLEKGKAEMAGIKNATDCLEWLYITGKERQTNCSLFEKTELKKVKIK